MREQEQFAQDLEMDQEALEQKLEACLQAPLFDPAGAPMEEQHLALAQLLTPLEMQEQHLWDKGGQNSVR